MAVYTIIINSIQTSIRSANNKSNILNNSCNLIVRFKKFCCVTDYVKTKHYYINNIPTQLKKVKNNLYIEVYIYIDIITEFS